MLNLLWPGFIFLLVLIPVIIAIYIWMLRRKRFAVRYSSLSLIRAALPRYSRVRRHLPFALFLIALASLIIALGRPIAIVAAPADQTVILLAIDVSRSMCSTDVQPNRILAAEAAALSFVQQKKSGTLIGVVAFSGFAEEIQPPTADAQALQVAIQSLTTGRRTAIGSGLLKAIDAIAEIDKSVAPSVPNATTTVEPAPVAPGAYAPDIVVLLTDGVSNTGPLPLEAAQQAVDRGIRVYTIGFGTPNGAEFPNCNLQFVGGEPGGRGQPPVGTPGTPGRGGSGFGGGGSGFGGGGGGFGGGGGRGGFNTRIDEAVLKQMAAMTGGTYHSAQTAGELQNVFQNLPTNLIMKHETTEISVAFTAIGAIFAALAIGLSMLWHPLS